MHLDTLDWIIIAVYFILSLLVGVYFSKRAGKNTEGFFLGGRNMSWWLAGISMVATTFAADTPLAVTELVAKDGIAGNWLWWSMLSGGMLTVFFFARLWRRAQILTEPEMIELRYSGQEAKLLRGFKAVYLGLFMNCIIIGWVNLAMMSVLEVFFGLTYAEALMYTALMMLLTAGYSALSGLLGVVMTDAVQFVIAMLGCIVLAIIVVNSESIGGVEGLKTQLPSGSLNFFPSIDESPVDLGTRLTITAGAFFAFIGVQWWASWYPGAEPGGGGYIAQRMMSTKNEKHALGATLFFQIAHYCLRPWPWIIVGLCSLVLYPELSDENKKLGYVYAMRDFLPSGWRGLLLVAFFAAYMSTISTQLNWGASYLLNDLYRRFIKPPVHFDSEEAGEKHYVFVSRITTLIIMLFGFGITTQLTTISSAWSFIMQCGAGLGLVLILRWYWWRINAWSEIAATIAPFIAYGVSAFWLKLPFPDSFFLTVGFTTLVWILVTYLTPPVEQSTLTAFYQRVRPDGWWQPVRTHLQIEADGENRILWMALSWFSAIAFTYGILFLTGALVLQLWDNILFYIILVVLGAVGISIFTRRTHIFED